MEIEAACAPYALKPQRKWRKSKEKPTEWSFRNKYCDGPSGWTETCETGRAPRREYESADQFQALKERWERETANLSSVSQIVLNDAYQRIIGMGPAVLPRILAALSREAGFWFPALKAITGQDPIDETIRGDLEAMRKAWLAWAIKNGHILP